MFLRSSFFARTTSALSPTNSMCSSAVSTIRSFALGFLEAYAFRSSISPVTSTPNSPRSASVSRSCSRVAAVWSNARS